MSDDEQLLARYKARERFWAVLACYMGGILSDDQACTLLSLDYTQLFNRREEFREVGEALWKRYVQYGPTIYDDINVEAGAIDQMRRHSGLQDLLRDFEAKMGISRSDETEHPRDQATNQRNASERAAFVGNRGVDEDSGPEG